MIDLKPLGIIDEKSGKTVTHALLSKQFMLNDTLMSTVFDNIASQINSQCKTLTCIIVLCDSHSLQLLEALSKVGILIPRDLSLISFDNSPWSLIYGFSSVDSGFGYLGIQHFILCLVFFRYQKRIGSQSQENALLLIGNRSRPVKESDKRIKVHINIPHWQLFC